MVYAYLRSAPYMRLICSCFELHSQLNQPNHQELSRSQQYIHVPCTAESRNNMHTWKEIYLPKNFGGVGFFILFLLCHTVLLYSRHVGAGHESGPLCLLAHYVHSHVICCSNCIVFVCCSAYKNVEYFVIVIVIVNVTYQHQANYFFIISSIFTAISAKLFGPGINVTPKSFLIFELSNV